MVGHQMSAASLAVLTVAGGVLGELAEVLRSLGDADVLRLPQRESVHGRGRPRAAGRTVAVAHAFGFALYLELDGAAKAVALVSDHFSVSCFSRRRRAH